MGVTNAALLDCGVHANHLGNLLNAEAAREGLGGGCGAAFPFPTLLVWEAHSGSKREVECAISACLPGFTTPSVKGISLVMSL